MLYQGSAPVEPAIYIKDKAVIVLLRTEYGLLLRFTAYTVPGACIFFNIKEAGTLGTGSVLAQLCEGNSQFS